MSKSRLLEPRISGYGFRCSPVSQFAKNELTVPTKWLTKLSVNAGLRVSSHRRAPPVPYTLHGNPSQGGATIKVFTLSLVFSEKIRLFSFMHLSILPLVTGAIALVSATVAGTSNPALAKRGILDPASYKNTTTSRGITYSYYFAPPASGDKRFLVLLHGWPGLSYDYRFQVDFFKDAGYGLIIPDMLGYGGTDKPTDLEAYKSSLITRDIVDILDRESVGDDAVVIGHDW